MSEFLAGFDGGGTGTRLRLTTLGGEVVATGKGGGANIAADPEGAWLSLRDAFVQARAALPESARIWSAAGLAGTESAGAKARFLAARPDGMPMLSLVTDAHTSCLGAHRGRDGAIMAIGTGSVGFALITDETGQTVSRRVGGWGFPQGDEGSGAWIGQRAVSAMLRAYDGRLTPDGLTQACWALLSEAGDPLSWAIGRGAAAFATLAPLVVESAAAGSPHAVQILRDAAAEIDHQIAALLDSKGFASLRLCLLGGLGPILSPYLAPVSQHILRSPHGDSVDGALILAKRYRTVSMEQFERQAG